MTHCCCPSLSMWSGWRYRMPTTDDRCFPHHMHRNRWCLRQEEAFCLKDCCRLNRCGCRPLATWNGWRCRAPTIHSRYFHRWLRSKGYHLRGVPCISQLYRWGRRTLAMWNDLRYRAPTIGCHRLRSRKHLQRGHT